MCASMNVHLCVLVCICETYPAVAMLYMCILIHIYTYMFGMYKPRRFVIKCKPNVNFCTMSIWVSIHIYFFHIYAYLFFCLPNKLYIIIIIMYRHRCIYIFLHIIPIYIYIHTLYTE